MAALGVCKEQVLLSHDFVSQPSSFAAEFLLSGLLVVAFVLELRVACLLLLAAFAGGHSVACPGLLLFVVTRNVWFDRSRTSRGSTDTTAAALGSRATATLRRRFRLVLNAGLEDRGPRVLKLARMN